MKIVKLQAENIKKLTAVEITPNGNTIEITGPNGSGKTSVLDAIYYALTGAAVIPNQVVRQGEEKAHVRLDLGELVVTRTFTAAGGTTLRVEAANGARFPSPQRMLDDLVGSLSFDPLAFSRLTPGSQLQSLKELLPELSVRLAKSEQDRNAFTEMRRGLRAALKQAEADLARVSDFPKDLPESVDLGALINELDAAGTSNTLREQSIINKKILEGRIEDNKLAASNREHEAVEVWEKAEERCRKIMAEANEQRVRLLSERDRLNVERTERLEVELDAFPTIPEKIDTAPIIERTNKARELGTLIGHKNAYDSLCVQRNLLKTDIEKAQLKIDTTVENDRILIEAAEMPITGLSLGKNEVLYLGRPLENASSSEQLRVSVAIAMAKNPKLRVLRVKDGSLLDAKALTELRDMVKAADYQLWIERVDDTHHNRPCIIMEDGHVQGADSKKSAS